MSQEACQGRAGGRGSPKFTPGMGDGQGEPQGHTEGAGEPQKGSMFGGGVKQRRGGAPGRRPPIREEPGVQLRRRAGLADAAEAPSAPWGGWASLQGPSSQLLSEPTPEGLVPPARCPCTGAHMCQGQTDRPAHAQWAQGRENPSSLGSGPGGAACAFGHRPCTFEFRDEVFLHMTLCL